MRREELTAGHPAMLPAAVALMARSMSIVYGVTRG